MKVYQINSYKDLANFLKENQDLELKQIENLIMQYSAKKRNGKPMFLDATCKTEVIKSLESIDDNFNGIFLNLSIM
ncbi:MAG: hypothetical protein ACI9O4_001226 [Chitinophagales bacterium]|jgi:hypothetical protein